MNFTKFLNIIYIRIEISTHPNAHIYFRGIFASYFLARFLPLRWHAHLDEKKRQSEWNKESKRNWWHHIKSTSLPEIQKPAKSKYTTEAANQKHRSRKNNEGNKTTKTAERHELSKTGVARWRKN